MTSGVATTLNLAAVLEQSARLFPNRIAVVDGSARLTYQAVNALAERVARELKAHAIGRGSHVALLCPNVAAFPVAYFGILKSGATVVPLNAKSTAAEVGFYLRDSDATVLVALAGVAAETARAAVEHAPACRHMWQISEGGVLNRLVPDARASDQGCSIEPAAARATDTAVIFYTSGTTGRPKGAELTHLNLVMSSLVTADHLRPALIALGGQAPVSLVTAPLAHTVAQVGQMATGFASGFTLVLASRFRPGPVLNLIATEGVNVWAAVPTMITTLLEYVEEQAIDPMPLVTTLRCVSVSGAPLPPELGRRFTAKFGLPLWCGYGTSETSRIAFTPINGRSKPGSVGPPIMGVDVRCVDADDQPVATGEPGEVVIQGHNVMKGYYKQPAATAQVMRNGWFHTGDIGVLDADGELSIVGRMNDVILRGGYSVYPAEIEGVIMDHPDVSAVAVIGVPNERFGEEVKAVIVARNGCQLTAETITSWCAERLASYKCPRLVEFRQRLPVNASGKIQKTELRDVPSGA